MATSVRTRAMRYFPSKAFSGAPNNSKRSPGAPRGSLAINTGVSESEASLAIRELSDWLNFAGLSARTGNGFSSATRQGPTRFGFKTAALFQETERFV